MKCSTCRFWARNTDDHPHLGRCHFRAPTKGPVVTDSDWPLLDEDDFCGSYYQKTRRKAIRPIFGPITTRFRTRFIEKTPPIDKSNEAAP